MNIYLIKTLGCKANFYDSQLIENELIKRGWKSFSQEASTSPAQLCIVNSCTVTDEADRQSRKLCSRLSRENPGAKIVITGCAAEVDPERMKHSKGIDYVIGNQNKPQLVELILKRLNEKNDTEQTQQEETSSILGTVQNYEQMISRHPHDREWPETQASFFDPIKSGFDPLKSGLVDTAKTRVFLKIQEGCNSFCTYCVIPYGRGPSRSLNSKFIIEQIQSLVQSGVQEIILTGTNIGDYGSDWTSQFEQSGKSCFSNLVQQILQETSLPRLRLSSLDPVEIDDQLIDLMSNNTRLCPHFHVSLQHVSDKILKLMKRKYSYKDVYTCLDKISKIPTSLPGGVFIGMDFITGFPGETAEDFAEAYQLLAQLPWTRLHVFPYSERSGTPSTRLPHSVKQNERVERARKLNQLSLARQKLKYENILNQNKPLNSVLLENYNHKTNTVSGWTPNYIRVQVTGTKEKLTRYKNTSHILIPEKIYTDSVNHDLYFSSTALK